MCSYGTKIITSEKHFHQSHDKERWDFREAKIQIFPVVQASYHDPSRLVKQKMMASTPYISGSW